MVFYVFKCRCSHSPEIFFQEDVGKQLVKRSLASRCCDDVGLSFAVSLLYHSSDGYNSDTAKKASMSKDGAKSEGVTLSSDQ